ncbi:MAG: DUF4185 domain-containing protein [Actinomycetota bacterium]|nr:DUF5005 domain-containing protein [Actinomycetota bacterium]
MKRIVVAIALLAASFVAHPSSASVISAGPDTALNQRLFSYGDTGTGWTGADGTYSVKLPDGRIIWIFSDTFLGSVNQDHSRDRGTPFINNSFIVDDGTNMSTMKGGNEFQARSLLETTAGAGYYWMGDATVEGDKLRVFLMKFVAVGFEFQQIGVDVATFSLPSMQLDGITPLPLAFVPGSNQGPVAYGNAILEADDYTYIYGVEDLHLDKFLHIARAARGNVMGSWEYFDGEGWSSNPIAAARLLSGVANELSIVKAGSSFRLITQDHAIGKDILMFTAAAPEGPWLSPEVVYSTPETAGNVFTYNAKEHPELDTPGKIVISYNVNSSDTNDVYADVDNYRPRFVDIYL